MPTLPRDVLDELTAIVGDEYLHTAQDTVASHSRDVGPWRTLAAAIIEPADAEQIAAIVRIANAERIPLWTFSGGWNWGYGAAMGLYDGALIMLLRRLDKIIEVNTELAYAVIEPGVTQGQLRAHLDAIGSGLWSDSTDSTPKGSVIGNALEHGVGYTPLCDHFGALCGIEAVLADGTIVRTGGGPPHSKTWHTHRWGTGPSIEGLFGQSNMGVVTRAGIWLLPAPERSNLALLELDDEAGLAAAIDVLRDLSLRRLIPGNMHVVNEVLLAAIMGQYPKELLGEGERHLSSSALAELRARYNIAPYSLTLGLYGSKAQIRGQRRVLRKGFAGLGKLTIVGETLGAALPKITQLWRRVEDRRVVNATLRKLTGASPSKLHATSKVLGLLRGTPSEHVLGFAYFKAREARPERDLDPARDGGGMIWLPCTLPLTGHDVRAAVELCRPIYHEHGFDYSNSFISINSRTAMSLMQIYFDIDDPDESARALALQQALFTATQAAGYPQYRTGQSLHEQMFEDAPGYQKVIRAIKRALDPNGVLAPGRYGSGGSGG